MSNEDISKKLEVVGLMPLEPCMILVKSEEDNQTRGFIGFIENIQKKFIMIDTSQTAPISDDMNDKIFNFIEKKYKEYTEIKDKK